MNDFLKNDKLIELCKQMTALMRENDVTGIVCLHTPGFAHFEIQLEANYSVCKFEGDNLRIKATKEDFDGDIQAQKKKVKDTANQLHLLFETTGRVCMSLHAATELLDKKLNAIHYETNNKN